jgi:hypothetical protein
MSMSELSLISDLAAQQLQLQEELGRLEAAVIAKKEELRVVQEELLPNALTEAGTTSFTLLNGMKISFKDEIYCSIPKDDPDHALNWLRDNDYDGIIKTQVVSEFGKGEDAEARRTVDALIEMGVAAAMKSTVHPMTLKSFIRELLSKGINVPMETFHASIVRKSIIK